MQTQMTAPQQRFLSSRSGSFASLIALVGRVLPTASLDHAHRDGLCHHFANLVGTISKRRAHNVYLRRCNGSPIVVARGHLSFPREKEMKNGLENSKNRGSSGGDGNQHVRLRGSQIAGCDNHRIRRRRTVVATTCPKKGTTAI